MSGHSKWAKIKRKKAANDAKLSKVWSKNLREITIAARFGADPAGNPRLRTAIATAKANNLSSDTIQRAIQRAAGTGDANAIEECTYEAYGPNGVAILIECATDNRNRTAAEIRHALSKNGGALGEPNSVAWLFDKKGSIVVPRGGVDEEELLMTALDAGAEDVSEEDPDTYEVVTGPDAFDKTRAAVEEAGFPIENAALQMIPKTTVRIESADAKRVLKLLDALEDLDDVQNVYANFDMDESVMSEIEETAA